MNSTQVIRPAAAAPTSLLVAAAVTAALAWSMVSGDVARALPLTLPKVPYLRSAIATISDIVVLVALAAFAARRSPARILSLTGLPDFSRRHLIWAGLVFGPVVIAAALLAPLASGLTATDFVWPGVVAPFAEEVFYRGLAVGLLMRVAGWRFLPAVLWLAVFFGLAHLWQGNSPAETTMAVAITGIGGLGFGWLFVRWGFALWPAIFLHIGMNSLWTAFALGENAVGGLAGNGLRLATIILAIGLTLWMAPRPPPRAQSDRA